MKKEYDVLKARKAQRKYCDEEGLPLFAPFTGICFKCGKNIYEEKEYRRGNTFVKKGIDVDKATNELVTGCPHCSMSYVD